MTRWLTLGVRYQYSVSGLLQPEEVDFGWFVATSHDLLATTKLRWFTDEIDRSAWSASAGLGYAFRDGDIADSGPIGRAAIAREVGYFVNRRDVITGSLELAATQALDDPNNRAVVASLGFGAELDIRDPRNLASEPAAPPLDYTSGVYFGALPAGMGLGVDVGIPLGDHLALRANADAWMLAHGEITAQYSLLGGLRLLPWEFGRDKFAYAEAQIGPSINTRDAESTERQLSVDLEFGARLGSCHSGFDWAMRFRNRVEDGLEVQGAVMLLRFEYEQRGKWRKSSQCNRGSAPRAPTTTTYWQPPTSVSPPDMPAAVEEPVPVEPAPAPPAPAPAPRPTAETEVEVVIEPIVVEVTLGRVFLGGAVEVAIDPRLIPLRRLRTGAWLEVELSGPSAVLARYQTALSANLSHNRLSVHAWARAATTSGTVKAKFTIWPKRPPGR